LKPHTAIYGSIKMERTYCHSCKGYAFVIDGKLLCCNKPILENLGPKNKIMSGATHKRKKPSMDQKNAILRLQGNRCLYCNKQYGTPYIHDKKLRFTYICYDHFTPFSYTQHSKDTEFVGSCNVCNSIKNNKIFATIEDAVRYIDYKRRKKGYEYYEDKEAGNNES